MLWPELSSSCEQAGIFFLDIARWVSVLGLNFEPISFRADNLDFSGSWNLGDYRIFCSASAPDVYGGSSDVGARNGCRCRRPSCFSHKNKSLIYVSWWIPVFGLDFQPTAFFPHYLDFRALWNLGDNLVIGARPPPHVHGRFSDVGPLGLTRLSKAHYGRQQDYHHY